MTVEIAYSSVNPHAPLVSLAEKRGLFAACQTWTFIGWSLTFPAEHVVVQTMVSGDIDPGGSSITGAPGVAPDLAVARRRYSLHRDDRRSHGLPTGDAPGY